MASLRSRRKAVGQYIDHRTASIIFIFVTGQCGQIRGDVTQSSNLSHEMPWSAGFVRIIEPIHSSHRRSSSILITEARFCRSMSIDISSSLCFGAHEESTLRSAIIHL